MNFRAPLLYGGAIAHVWSVPLSDEVRVVDNSQRKVFQFLTKVTLVQDGR